jgi:hypothetical protein
MNCVVRQASRIVALAAEHVGNPGRKFADERGVLHEAALSTGRDPKTGQEACPT